MRSETALNLEVRKPKINRPESPVAQSPLLMPMLNVKKIIGNESVRSGSSRGFKKPSLNPNGLRSRLAQFRPKMAIGGGS